jgi:hypothetical protein
MTFAYRDGVLCAEEIPPLASISLPPRMLCPFLLDQYVNIQLGSHFVSAPYQDGMGNPESTG